MNGVILDFSRPSKPTDTSFLGALYGKVRAECIDQKWFLSLADAQVKCGVFRHDCNYEHPHSSIGQKTPMESIKSNGNPNRLMVSIRPEITLSHGPAYGATSRREKSSMQIFVRLIVISIAILPLAACLESEVSEEKYDSGWAEAESQLCRCNPNYWSMDNSKEAQAGLGWADGYVDGCLEVRRRLNCQ